MQQQHTVVARMSTQAVAAHGARARSSFRGIQRAHRTTVKPLGTQDHIGRQSSRCEYAPAAARAPAHSWGGGARPAPAQAAFSVDVFAPGG
jgi:hypothetical protein